MRRLSDRIEHHEEDDRSGPYSIKKPAIPDEVRERLFKRLNLDDYLIQNPSSFFYQFPFMIESPQLGRISQALPVLKDASSELVREFQQAAFLARIPAGHDVFLEGDSVEAIALLISGVVRVYKIGETGREITLYRFGHGNLHPHGECHSQKSFPAIARERKPKLS
jgi:hypothetical protein